MDKEISEITDSNELSEWIKDKAEKRGGDLHYQIGYLTSALAHANHELILFKENMKGRLKPGNALYRPVEGFDKIMHSNVDFVALDEDEPGTVECLVVRDPDDLLGSK